MLDKMVFPVRSELQQPRLFTTTLQNLGYTSCKTAISDLGREERVDTGTDRIDLTAVHHAGQSREMSTQDAESISFLYDRDLQGLRLLELPPELLDLLNTQDPPRCVRHDICAWLC